MHYVYLLKSYVNGDIYVGSSGDLRQRISDHNNGRVTSTKPFRPWKLIYYEAYLNKKDATKRESQLKDHKPKNDLMKQITASLKDEVTE